MDRILRCHYETSTELASPVGARGLDKGSGPGGYPRAPTHVSSPPRLIRVFVSPVYSQAYSWTVLPSSIRVFVYTLYSAVHSWMAFSHHARILHYNPVSIVAKNRGARLARTACSKANASRSSVPSWNAPLKKDMPTGNPKINPAGTVICG